MKELELVSVHTHTHTHAHTHTANCVLLHSHDPLSFETKLDFSMNGFTHPERTNVNKSIAQMKEASKEKHWQCVRVNRGPRIYVCT